MVLGSLSWHFLKVCLQRTKVNLKISLPNEKRWHEMFKTREKLRQKEERFWFVSNFCLLLPPPCWRESQPGIHHINFLSCSHITESGRTGIKSWLHIHDLTGCFLHLIWPVQCWSGVMKSNPTPSSCLNVLQLNQFMLRHPRPTLTVSNMLLNEHDRYVSFNLADLWMPFTTFHFNDTSQQV